MRARGRSSLLSDSERQLGTRIRVSERRHPPGRKGDIVGVGCSGSRAPAQSTSRAVTLWAAQPCGPPGPVRDDGGDTGRKHSTFTVDTACSDSVGGQAPRLMQADGCHWVTMAEGKLKSSNRSQCNLSRPKIYKLLNFFDSRAKSLSHEWLYCLVKRADCCQQRLQPTRKRPECLCLPARPTKAVL